MHRCLEITEILKNVFDNFNYFARRRNLYALALVSKGFHEPALDILWQLCGSVLHLVKTLPVEVWEETGDPLTTLFLRRALVASDFERFRFYGKRVRRLLMDTTGNRRRVKPYQPEIDASVFQAIACAMDIFQFEGPLLPNLREIFCNDTEGHTLWNIYPFLPSKLLSFRLRVERPPDLATMTILSALKVKSPHIQHFGVVDGWFYKDQLAPLVSSSLCGLLHLCTVECAGVTLTPEAILHLAFLPNLREVDIRVADDQIDIKSSAHIPFPALRCLSLNCESMATAIEFVKTMIHSAPLTSFTVRVENPPSSAQLGRMFSLLSAQSCFVHLTDIHFCHPEFIDYEDDFLPLLDAHDFEPLLKFTHMESIYIETQCSIANFDDELLKAMATSWPNLRHLCLTNGQGVSFPSRCTLRGILHLGQHCPNLQSLRIGFQASVEICWNGRPGGGVVNEYMEALEVVESPIADPRAVAYFLSDVFPRLTSIDAWDNFNPEDPTEVENRKRWQEAIQLYDIFVAIRNEERQWAVSAGCNEREIPPT